MVSTSRSSKRVVQIKKIQKRDGSFVPFDLEKIAQAIYRAMQATGEGSFDAAKAAADNVLADLLRIKKRYENFIPTIEGIQDAVEENLMSEFPKTAKAYILYRDEHAKLRKEATERLVPPHVKKLVEESQQYFHNLLGQFVYIRTYARWIDEEARRETWIETVNRYIAFMKENLGDKLKDKEYEELREAILKQEVMPSMRLMQFSGNAARKTHVCAYNCSFIAPRKLKDFSEIMYILMCGSGVGFSVESENVEALPQIKMQIGKKLPVFVIPDSREGWCDALALGLRTWCNGEDIEFDFSLLRPAGARLKTFGGRSSGPEPLRSLLNFARAKILKRQGRRLTTLNVYDIICKIGEVVVSGGVRRSAMISLSDLDDQEMRDAKKGQFYYTESQRTVTNNSAIYKEKPSNQEFLEEWTALMKSGSGERGIFNRENLVNTLPKRRLDYFRKKGLLVGNRITGMIGVNPCGEIILQSKQFCNLTEVIARPKDDEQSLLHKIRLATILGTYQATLTNFPYLSKEWKQHSEAERLLGVSITGQWDCHAVRTPKVLQAMREKAIEVNRTYAKRFGITPSHAITCVKPSGTVSQTFDCASGMHPRYAPYYIRRVRIAATDTLFQMLKNQGIPYYPEVGQPEESATTYVLEFPVKAPAGSVCRTDLSALQQLEYWKMLKLDFTEHNPSVTISIGEEEWIRVANWVYDNWNVVGGLSFLPLYDYAYPLAPYEEIDKTRYEELVKQWESVDFSELILYEKQDVTDMKRELACSNGSCDLL